MPAEGDVAHNQAEPDPRKRDYAIVIGVPKYPSLSRDGASVDLAGPIQDAEKMRAWLANETGGGVPADNIEYVVRAGETPAANPDPTRDVVVQAFTRMYARCWDPNGAPKVPTGRRLYVYASGHGLANDLDHGALLCSNSSPNWFATVAPYASLKAFRQAGFFDQFVVWFDGCLDWAGLEPDAINYNPRPGNSLKPPGPVFSAYAAHPRLRAMECPDAAGVVHGVFTQTLLAGLEGGADVDPTTGLIDGFGLQKYLTNTMSKFLPASAKDSTLVDKQPFVRTDPGIFFGTPKPAANSPVLLRFGAAQEGATARVWGRKQNETALSILASQPVRNAVIELNLPNGIYAVDVPDHGLRTGFEVTGGIVTKLAAG
jgi:uncharacterized caspase-like protein